MARLSRVRGMESVEVKETDSREGQQRSLRKIPSHN